MGCGRGYKEKVIAAKEFTPLERAVKMLEGYAAGEPVGSEFMGFELLREELRSHNADPTGDRARGAVITRAAGHRPQSRPLGAGRIRKRERCQSAELFG
jgi:hypothetical protein